MNCDQIGEYLPWYVNNSLEEAEREEIARHLGSCTRCAEELAATRQAFEVFDAHLPPSVLTDLVEERPPAISEELARRHLDSCERCAEDLELARAARAAVEAADAPDGVVTPFAPRPRRLPRWSAVAQPLAAAASLVAAVAVAGWVWTAQVASERAAVVADLEERLEAAQAVGESAEEWSDRLEAARLRIGELEQSRGELAERVEDEERRLAELRSRLARARAPRLNVAIRDLFPAAALTRGGAEGAGTAVEITREEGGRGIVLILNTESGWGNGPVRVELLDAEDAVLWSLDGLRRSPTGDYTLALPELDLPAGDYALRLTAPSGEAELYPLRVASG